MRVFVSGEDGLLPNAVMRSLETKGAEVLNARLPRAWQPPPDIMHRVGASRIREPEVDVLDKGTLAEIRMLRPDLVLHAAAMVGTDKCEINEDLAWRCNVETTYNMAVLARDVGARLVYFSSSAAYDPDESVPRPYSVLTDVDHPPNPRTIYGQTKYLGEHVCRQVYGEQGLLIVRPSFVYGGVRDTSSTIIRIAKAVLFDGPPADVLLDAGYLKDFMHIEDFTALMVHLIVNGVTGSYDVVRGEPRHFGDALAILYNLLGFEAVKSKMNWMPREDYMRDHYADGRPAWYQTGYKPFVRLEDGLAWSVRELEQYKGRWWAYAER